MHICRAWCKREASLLQSSMPDSRCLRCCSGCMAGAPRRRCCWAACCLGQPRAARPSRCCSTARRRAPGGRWRSQQRWACCWSCCGRRCPPRYLLAQMAPCIPVLLEGLAIPKLTIGRCRWGRCLLPRTPSGEMYFFYKFHMQTPVVMALRLAAGWRGLPGAAVRVLPAPVGRAARPGHGGGRRRHVRRGARAAAPLAPLARHCVPPSLPRHLMHRQGASRLCRAPLPPLASMSTRCCSVTAFCVLLCIFSC